MSDQSSGDPSSNSQGYWKDKMEAGKTMHTNLSSLENDWIKLVNHITNFEALNMNTGVKYTAGSSPKVAQQF